MSVNAAQLKSKYDCIIIGGGHNGLVTAGYLAKAGHKVAVFEKRNVVGGCAVTEEPFKGYKFSSLSYVNSLFRPEIIRDLKLKDFGFEMLPRSPSSFSPFLNNKYLMLGPDKKMVHDEIAKFSKKDAENYPKYEAMLEDMAAVLEPLMTMVPPNPGNIKFSDITGLGGFLMSNRKKIRSSWPELMRFLTGSATDMLNHWFESEELKVTLATDAVIGANASPSMPGTSYILFHHVMGECEGVRGVWGYMRGGMGGLTQSLAKSCQSMGVDIFTSKGVDKILVENGKAVGIVAGSDEVRAKIVVSGADPNMTFNKMVDQNDLPESFKQNIRRINYDSAAVKINLALSELPNFNAYPGIQSGPQHRGTIHISPDMQYIEEAYSDSVAGRPSKNPILECTIPTSVDNTLAPAGHHVMNMFVQYGPYNLKNGQTWDQIKETFADRCVDIMTQYAPNFKNSIIHRQVISPLDMERDYHVTGGSLFHGRMTLDQMFHMRPVPGYANYRTPIKNLYICGSGAHPGGGVMGTPGWNAAREIQKDM